MTRQQLFAAFFFAVLLLLLLQLYSLFSAFIVPLIWTVIFVLTFYPLHTLLLRLLGGRRSLTAFLLTVFVVLLVGIPVFLLSSVLASQVVDFYQLVRAAAESGELQRFLSSWQQTSLGQLWQRWGPRIEAFDIDLPALALTGANTASQFIAGQLTGIAKNLFVFLLDFLLMSFSLFFFFRDGEEFYRALRDLIPMQPEHKDAIFQQFYETVSAVVQGMAVTAVVQGVLAGIGFLIVGLPFSFFLGCASALSSLQPFGGAAVVWFPCTLYLFYSGTWGWGVFLLVYGIVVISGVDNIIKPWIIGERTKLPTLFLFLGILGGLQAYGFLGLFLGPVILATLVAFIKIYREEYAHRDVTL